MRCGYSYIEIIISMTLISILGLGLANGFSISLRNYDFARENYFAEIAAENLLNAAEEKMDNENSIADILNNSGDNFYTDKFNFTVRVNEIGEDFSVSKENFDKIDYGGEKFLPVETKIFSDNPNLFADISKSGSSNYLLTVDIFNKNHKFLKRLTKIISHQ